MYDWDIIRKSAVLGSVTVTVDSDGETSAVWHPVDGPSGMVCLHVNTIPIKSSGALNGYAGANARRRIFADKQGPTMVHQRPGPLQNIFDLPADENPLEEYSVAMQTDRQLKLFLIMSEMGDFRYSLYGIPDPQLVPANAGGDVATITDLGKPLLEMHMSIFPRLMSFIAIDSRIFMVGGASFNDAGKPFACKEVFIYDTSSSSSTPLRGPPLNFGMVAPHLVALGSQIFALSDVIYHPNDASQPRFEMLDTRHLECGWTVLPVPVLKISTCSHVYLFAALTTAIINGRGFIFLSVDDAIGTYAFDVHENKWDYVSNQKLPFSGNALSIPHAPSMCCDWSLKSDRFCAFRFSFGGDETTRSLQVDEVEIEDSYSCSPLLPEITPCRSGDTVLGPDGRIYFIIAGVDLVQSPMPRHHYVKVYALEFPGPNIGHGEDQDEINKLDSDKGPSLKRCRTMNMRHMERGEVETKELKLNGIWKASFCGGLARHPCEHVVAAVAM